MWAVVDLDLCLEHVLLVELGLGPLLLMLICLLSLLLGRKPPQVDVADVVGRDEKLLLLEDQDVGDEVIFDCRIVATSPDLTLLVWRLRTSFVASCNRALAIVAWQAAHW